MMHFTFAKNPAPAIGRAGEPGWPELRAEIHTYKNGFGGYLGHDGASITNADGVTCIGWRVLVDKKDFFTVDETDTNFYPMIVRLPHGHGFYHGWTMGESMVANIPDLHVAQDEEAAWHLARQDAEHAAQEEVDSLDNSTEEYA